jgi:hypothetical protein
VVAELGLAEAVEALRAELVKAVSLGSGESMRFALAPIELTLQAVVTKDAHGTIGWQIVEFGGKYESAVTQTVKLTLTPKWRKPGSTDTEDKGGKVVLEKLT